MVSYIVSDEFRVRLVLIVALICLGAVCSFIGATFRARARADLSQQRIARVQAQWRPVIWRYTAFDVAPNDVPYLAREDVLDFSRYWIESLNRFDGAARERLLELGRQLKLAPLLRRYFSATNPGDQALAACVSGWLGCRASVPHLRRALKSINPTLSFTAGMALVRIDRKSFGGRVVGRACKGDWGANYVTKVIRELEPAATTNAFLTVMAAHSPSQGGGLLHAWSQVDYPAAVEFSRRVLENPASDGWLIGGALRVLRSPSDVHLVRPYLDHELWSVQVQAVNSMARIGLRWDVEGLSVIDTDDNWWLQERIIEAVHTHPQISPEAANQMERRVKNPQKMKVVQC